MPKRGGRSNNKASLQKKRSGSNGLPNGRLFPKKKTRYRGKKTLDQEVPELMDLQGNDPSSMRFNSKRPGRMVDEVAYTERNHDKTLSTPLRLRPLVFVKATEVYDPSKKKAEVILKDDVLLKEVLLKDVISEDVTLKDLIPKDSILKDEVTEKNALLEILQSKPSNDNDSDLSHIEESEDEQIFESFEGSPEKSSNDDDDIIPEDTPQVLEIGIDQVRSAEISDTDESLSADIETPDEFVRNNISSQVIDKPVADLIPIDELKIQEDISFVLDDEADEELLDFPKEPISTLLRNSFRANFVDEDDEEEFIISNDINKENLQSSLEFDPVLTIGKVSLNTTKDKDNNTTTNLMSIHKKVKTGFINERKDINYDSDISLDSNNSGYKDYVQQVMQGMHDNSDYDDNDEYDSDTNFDIMATSDNEDIEAAEEENIKEDEDPEYGFLPEDFEFDVSRIMITNVRFGITNQFFVKCHELTSSEDFHWVDEEDVIEYITMNGVKEHRIHSFLKFVTGGLIEDKPPQDDYSDVYISESSEEENDEDDDGENNLMDLVEFSKGMAKSFLNSDHMTPTESMQTKGKGRKKVLNLDKYDLNSELIESLQNQYQIHRERKKSKKNAKDEAKVAEAMRNHDLLVKYPYSLHVNDMRLEFELFLHDSFRDSLSFPPLDPHGNKTLMKMSTCYNMRSMRVGPHGKKGYVMVRKYKGTYHYLPKYDEINHMLRQRPIFHRADQKRLREEYTATDGNAKKDKARGRNSAPVKMLKEGDIVGDKAPEIGMENIGRQLLMKLGWKAGEGLGHNKQGINAPIQATIKMSKVGLRETT